MSLSKRERNLLVMTIAVIAVVANYLPVAPLRRQWDSVADDIRNRERQLDGMKAYLQRKDGWQSEYDELRRGVNQTAGQLQTTSEVLKKIEEVGKASGVQFVSRRPLPEVDKGVYRELPVQCSYEATTESLVRFLHALVTASGFIRVEQLTVSPKPDNPSILRCDSQVRALAGKMEGPTS